MAEELVLTPGGYRPKSLVHKIEPDHILRRTDRHLQKVHLSGTVVDDFGAITEVSGNEPLLPRTTRLLPNTMLRAVPALGYGWIAYAFWNNDTGTPISSFRTTWVVPPAPSTQSGQTIFLFNGIQNSSWIYQPVLQWGPSAAGGGNQWSVASWYVDGPTAQVFFTNLVNVNPGDTLIGVMTLTRQNNTPTGTTFDYNCFFQGIANTNLAIQNIQELTWCTEALEAYGPQSCSDYPNTNRTAMTAIDIQTGNNRPSVAWAPSNPVTDCGQHAVVLSNSNPGSHVDLVYRLRWISLGGQWSSIPVVGRNQDGRLEVFIVGQNGQLYQRFQTSPNNGWNDRWESLGGSWDASSYPSVANNADGRLEIFIRGQNEQLYQTYQTFPNNGWI